MVNGKYYKVNVAFVLNRNNEIWTWNIFAVINGDTFKVLTALQTQREAIDHEFHTCLKLPRIYFSFIV